jgi:hypothetical protein
MARQGDPGKTLVKCPNPECEDGDIITRDASAPSRVTRVVCETCKESGVPGWVWEAKPE